MPTAILFTHTLVVNNQSLRLTGSTNRAGTPDTDPLVGE